MEQPTIQDEKELMDINDDAKTIVEIPRSKKKYKIGYLKSYCTEKVTKIILQAEPESPNSELSVLTDIKKRSRLHHKAAALIILNDWYKIVLFYSIFWRWLFFVKEYSSDQLFPIILEGKKKIQAETYSLNMGFLALIMETKKEMTMKEAKAYQAELLLALERNSANQTLGR